MRTIRDEPKIMQLKKLEKKVLTANKGMAPIIAIT